MQDPEDCPYLEILSQAQSVLLPACQVMHLVTDNAGTVTLWWLKSRWIRQAQQAGRQRQNSLQTATAAAIATATAAALAHQAKGSLPS